MGLWIFQCNRLKRCREFLSLCVRANWPLHMRLLMRFWNFLKFLQITQHALWKLNQTELFECHEPFPPWELKCKDNYQLYTLDFKTFNSHAELFLIHRRRKELRSLCHQNLSCEIHLWKWLLLEKDKEVARTILPLFQ